MEHPDQHILLRHFFCNSSCLAEFTAMLPPPFLFCIVLLLTLHAPCFIIASLRCEQLFMPPALCHLMVVQNQDLIRIFTAKSGVAMMTLNNRLSA